jgi:UDP-N-acetylmuramate dehydrogenase
MLSSAAGLDHPIPGLTFRQHEPLSRHTRFGIGGPARAYVECRTEDALRHALSAGPCMVIGGGTNLVVSDEGVDGVVVRSTADRIEISGTRVYAEAGADLQALVDATIAAGLRGIETMTGIPGSVGGAVYGNAGAYGHSICERIVSVRFLENGRPHTFTNAECEFHYRESVFKRHKERIVLSAELTLDPAESSELRARADEIRSIRDRKYPPDMKCAGSIFKNLILSELAPDVAGRVPPAVIREGKVPSAWFLEEVHAKGMHDGDIRVADYHANLIYNAGQGTAAQVRRIIVELKRRVSAEFGLALEEEVQYVGFTF